jgi:hypothetical protein
MPVNGRRPFTELFEVTQRELVREAASGEEDKYKGMINQIYSNDLPSVLPELFIKKEAFITLVSDYTTGTVTVGSGTANIIGSSTSWTSANSDGRLIKISGRDMIYRVTFAAGTSLTFQDGLTWVGSSGSGLTYTLFQDRYALPSDFSHMIKDDADDPHVVYRYVSGKKVYLTPKTEEEFEKERTSSVGIPFSYCIKWISETPYMYISLAADSAEILGYSFIPQLTTLIEYTTGTAAFGTTTAITADSGTTAWSTTITTGTNTYFLRNDADGVGSSSRWIEISSVGGTSSLTLTSAWIYTSGTGQSYTISEISKWPARFDDAILYKSAFLIDPDNLQAGKWNSIYQEAVGLDRAVESKRMQTQTLKHFSGMRRK